jgi:hypothetical protein
MNDHQKRESEKIVNLSVGGPIEPISSFVHKNITRQNVDDDD